MRPPPITIGGGLTAFHLVAQHAGLSKYIAEANTCAFNKTGVPLCHSERSEESGMEDSHAPTDISRLYYSRSILGFLVAILGVEYL
jgi:hypothetical protein